MTDDQWRQIDTLFAVAYAQPIERRTAWLRDHVADPVVRGQVASLLSHATAGPIGELHQAILDTSAAAAGALAAVGAGARFGPYRLTRLLGRGGMGIVYLAERDDDRFHKQVAIKVIRHGMATPALIDRFRQERRILARLEHPHIARLLDGGETADGLPYLVMEYVEGVPLLAWCEQRDLAAVDRLRLFLPICAAVEYAHRNLVVHRDLKTGNILVASDGTAKLLDFGIARLLEPGTAAAMTLVPAWTPAYASPEQKRGDAVTTSSDIYSLGIVLHELLTGHLPPDAPETTRLHGELRAIVDLAMHQDAERRYASAGALAEDINRWLGGRPVVAHADTPVYRARKFVRRNRALVVAVALAVAGPSIGLVVSVRQTRLAQQRFQEVRTLANRMITDFEPKIRDVPGTIDAQRMLASTATEYLDRLREGAGDDDELLLEIAKGYDRIAGVEGLNDNQNLGDQPAAQRTYAKALAIGETLMRRRKEDTRVAALVSAVHLRTGVIDSVNGRRKAAIAHFDEAITVGERNLRLAPGDAKLAGIVASAENRAGDLLMASGRVAEARQRFERAFAVMQPHGRPPVTTRARLAGALREEGDTTGALALFRECEQEIERGPASEQSHEARHTLTLLRGDIGLTLAQDPAPGAQQAALAAYRRAIAGGEALVAMSPKDASSRIVLFDVRVGFATVAAGVEPASAVAVLRETLPAVSALIRQTPADDLKLLEGRGRTALSRALARTGRPAEARDEARRAMTTLEAVAAGDPENTIVAKALAEARAALAGATR